MQPHPPHPFRRSGRRYFQFAKNSRFNRAVSNPDVWCILLLIRGRGPSAIVIARPCRSSKRFRWKSRLNIHARQQRKTLGRKKRVNKLAERSRRLLKLKRTPATANKLKRREPKRRVSRSVRRFYGFSISELRNRARYLFTFEYVERRLFVRYSLPVVAYYRWWGRGRFGDKILPGNFRGKLISYGTRIFSQY